jgi:hypothetical protein
VAGNGVETTAEGLCFGLLTFGGELGSEYCAAAIFADGFLVLGDFFPETRVATVAEFFDGVFLGVGSFDGDSDAGSVGLGMAVKMEAEAPGTGTVAVVAFDAPGPVNGTALSISGAAPKGELGVVGVAAVASAASALFARSAATCASAASTKSQRSSEKLCQSSSPSS